jgi:hypothetical protein
MPTLSDYSADLSTALDRFERIGVILRRGRYNVYETTLLQALQEPDRIDPRLINSAIAESIDLSSIAVLPDECFARHRATLTHIADGEAVYADAGEHDPGREIAFQFIVGSKFFAAGAHIDFENPSDVVATIDEVRVLIECKRLKTHAALGRGIREAFRQLSEHRRAAHEGLGVIAVELSSALNPEFLELLLAEGELPNAALHLEVERLFAYAREHLHRAARNRRPDSEVDILLFRAQCFMRLGRTRTCGTSWLAQPAADIGSHRFGEMQRILERMPGFVGLHGNQIG